MKLFVLVFVFACAGYTVNAQTTEGKAIQTEFVKPMTVEASCGTCLFKMDGSGCELAIRMEGKSYFVDGTDIHKHGDAHGANGFCNAIRKAEVTGKIEKDRFVATSFKLLPVKE